MSKDKKFHIDWDNVMMFLLVIMIIIVVGVAVYALIRYKPIRRSAAEAENEYLIYVSRTDNPSNTYIYYDKDTKVMYMINYHGGITVMVNPDGTPRLYEEDVNE